MSDVGCQMSNVDVWCQISDVPCPMSDVLCRMSHIRRLMSDVRCLIYYVWSTMSDVRCPTSWCLIFDVRCLIFVCRYPTSDVRFLRSDVRCLLSDVWIIFGYGHLCWWSWNKSTIKLTWDNKLSTTYMTFSYLFFFSQASIFWHNSFWLQSTRRNLQVGGFLLHYYSSLF